MYHIHCLNKISPKGTALLTDNYAITDDRNQADGVLVRSADMHNVALPESLLAVARAGAGVNNIPLSDCAEAGVVVFNTPGANANGVAELAGCAIYLASRDIVGGIAWAKTLESDVAKAVEKGKSAFAGVEAAGKTLGVIGLGAIGGIVANRAVHLRMQVVGCDPFLSVDAAWNLNHHIRRAATFDDVYREADYITLHVPATGDTKQMINAQNEKVRKLLSSVKDALLGFSSDELTVREKDGKVYVAMSDKLLFQSGSARLDKRGEEALGKLAEVLNKQTDIDVFIEGHTDNKPINTVQFKDNWDLSVIRATSVVRILIKNYNVNPLQIQPSGRGEYMPVDDNETAEGRSKNRRTEIIMAPKLDKLFQMLQSTEE